MNNILTNIGTNIKTRIRVLKCFVWSALLYGCESWTISKKVRKRIEAAEMWFWRRMKRIPWTAILINETVLQMVGTRRQIMTIIRRRQLGYSGHVLRENGVEKDSLMGIIGNDQGKKSTRKAKD